MPENQPNRPDPENRVGRLSKNAAFLMMMALMLLLAIQMVRGQGELIADFTYTEFREHLTDGRVYKVIFRDRQLEGELTQPVIREGQEFTRFETRLPGEVTDGLLEELAQRDVIIEAEPTDTGWGTLLLTALPWLLFIAFWIWIFRTMQGGGNRAFQFGRSKAKMISPDTPKVTFADVAGADEAKDGAPGDHRVPEGPGQVLPPGRTAAQGRAAGGPAGHGQDPAGARRGRRGRTALLPDVRLGLRRDVRRRRRLSGPRPVRAGEGPRAVHHLRRRDRRGRTAPGRGPRRRARRARADAQRAPRGDGRLRVERGRHPAGGHQPTRRARSRRCSDPAASTVRSSWTRRT